MTTVWQLLILSGYVFCYLQLWTSDANQDGDDDREGENN